MIVALEAMGGDNAPDTVVEGAISAARQLGVEVLLVGDEKAIGIALSKHDTVGLPISIVHAPQVVGMDESPASVIRRKRDSSIWIATDLVKQSKASAVISAGHTGASMATALFILGALPGVDRPAIATVLPTLTGRAVLLDVGANVDCKPQHLVQFAIMGYIYAKDVLGVPEPKVGLLSIGEEDSKGNELTKEAFKQLKETPMLSDSFMGNVEGRDVYMGEVDVIVCDGFTGNVALKISEGLSETIVQFLKRDILSSVTGRLGSLLLAPAFSRLRKKIDYAEYGGAPLLGVNGISIICHGRSSGRAIHNAIAVAKTSYERGVNRHIETQIGQAW